MKFFGGFEVSSCQKFGGTQVMVKIFGGSKAIMKIFGGSKATVKFFGKSKGIAGFDQVCRFSAVLQVAGKSSQNGKMFEMGIFSPKRENIHLWENVPLNGKIFTFSET